MTASDRPIYETDDDRIEEERIVGLVSERWKCQCRKLPRAYNLDYAFVRDHHVVAWAEIKRRYRTLNEYGGVFLSLQKVLTAERLGAVTGLRCFFIVHFNDCLAYADMFDPSRRLDLRGRSDRADWQDKEPAMLIPSYDFKIIG